MRVCGSVRFSLSLRKNHTGVTWNVQGLIDRLIHRLTLFKVSSFSQGLKVNCAWLDGTINRMGHPITDAL